MNALTHHAMRIEAGGLDHPAVAALLREHMDAMAQQSPAESVHAFGLARLRAHDIVFWTAWQGDALLGCAALKALDVTAGELKSMRTASAQRRRGVASQLLAHVVAIAHARGYDRLYLETGVGDGFAAAHALYRNAGFAECAPFGDYVEDPHSVFMVLRLDRAHT